MVGRRSTGDVDAVVLCPADCKDEKISDADVKLLTQSAFRTCMERIIAEKAC